MRIYKYCVPMEGVDIKIPSDAKVVHVAAQHDQPTIWVMLDPEAETMVRHFYIEGTGHDLDPADHYCGAAFVGPFVWHVLESENG